MTVTIGRRELLAALGGAAVWPLAARAQQGERVRRIGVLQAGNETDPLWKPGVFAFTQALAGLGWTDGRNARMDLRWGGGDINRMRAFAAPGGPAALLTRAIHPQPNDRDPAERNRSRKGSDQGPCATNG